ncbi:hypothetical protein EDD18DRAFT_1158001 [Armillaria luteobubalina]|uniref:NAD-dependent epimerase/dehydratase domain-containing protein n=1 Tax=Armillaria luteobubalina TaxID=153913 RepID=A0AA39UQ28_9AGAR|nr:hypothetical protein EDD18DRAFT_1158001 [Armillaria luteobubalina]
MSGQLILVTGSTGFIGCHIVEQLLESGYRVRAVARSAKVEQLKSTYADFGNRFDAVGITDIAEDTLTGAFEGVDAVIHGATAMPTRTSNVEDMIAVATNGTLNVLRRAEAAGYTASSVHWFQVPEGDNSKRPAMAVYANAKTLAEIAMWKWADEHPHVQISSIHPPYVYGPISRHWQVPEAPDYWALTSALAIATMLKPDGMYPPYPAHVDVRDVAKACVRGLELWKPAPACERNRAAFLSPQYFDYPRAKAAILERYPDLKSRIIAADPPPFYGPSALEYEWVDRLFGMKKEDFHTFDETVLDTVAMEDQGYNPQVPTPDVNDQQQ